MPNQPSTPVQVDDINTWHIRYRRGSLDFIDRRSSAEAAIETTCRLIDEGYDVYGIGLGSLADSIGPKEIARIYALRWRTSGLR
jgi:hypothetical protein